MHRKWLVFVFGTGVVWLAGVYSYAQPPWGSLVKHLFPPRLIDAAREEIGLTDSQAAFIRAEVKAAEQEFARLSAELKAEVASLAELLAAEKVDEQAATAQLEKVLAVEQQIKRRQLILLVRIKNTLDPEQQAKLRQIRVRRAARAKLKQVEQLAKRRSDQGRGSALVRKLKAELKPLWEAGKFIEAEKLIDRALRQLKIEVKE